jgi:hypothetical protein
MLTLLQLIDMRAKEGPPSRDSLVSGGNLCAKLAMLQLLLLLLVLLWSLSLLLSLLLLLHDAGEKARQLSKHQVITAGSRGRLSPPGPKSETWNRGVLSIKETVRERERVLIRVPAPSFSAIPSIPSMRSVTVADPVTCSMVIVSVSVSVSPLVFEESHAEAGRLGARAALAASIASMAIQFSKYQVRTYYVSM